MTDGALAQLQLPGLETKCLWCDRVFGAVQAGQKFCTKRHRQSAFRARRLLTLGTATTPLRFAYADPPYPGLSRRYYQREPTYAGEVDHDALARRLAGFDGWALSTSARSLGDVLGLLARYHDPGSFRVGSWVKPGGLPATTKGPHNRWEPLIVRPVRRLGPVRDWIEAQPARHGGTLMGRKPIKVCCWMFELVGAQAGDDFSDLYPGTGVVSSVWRSLTSGSNVDHS